MQFASHLLKLRHPPDADHSNEPRKGVQVLLQSIEPIYLYCSSGISCPGLGVFVVRGIAGTVEVDVWAAELESLLGRVGGLFGRVDLRWRTRDYVRGLLGPVTRKNGWQLAEYAGHRTPEGVQHLLNGARWNAEALRDEVRNYMVEHLGPGGVLITDDTGFVKKGTTSAGVGQQYTGTSGQIDNCQIGGATRGRTAKPAVLERVGNGFGSASYPARQSLRRHWSSASTNTCCPLAGGETVRDIDQPTAVFRRVLRETCPALVGDLVAEFTEQHSPEALLFLAGQQCGSALRRPQSDVVKVSYHCAARSPAQGPLHESLPTALTRCVSRPCRIRGKPPV
ncbi:transposase [Streptomyces sp. NPDC058409]|uniref:transposase n=1 Tax=Streptomyces sp. NPDC058409 TaxID=3346484 RepID=UPI00364DE0DB